MAEVTRAVTGFCANCKDCAVGSPVDGERVFPDVEGMNVESEGGGSFIRGRHSARECMTPNSPRRLHKDSSGVAGSALGEVPEGWDLRPLIAAIIEVKGAGEFRKVDC